MDNRTLGVRYITGEVFYGKINKEGVISPRAIDIPNDKFEFAMLQYLMHEFRTDVFSKPYIVDLANTQKKYKITVEVLDRGSDE